MNTRTRVMAMAALALLAAGRLAWGDAVLIRTPRGTRRITGRIVRDDRTGVAIRTSSGPATFSLDDVVKVVYNDWPPPSGFAKIKFNKGEYKSAYNLFKRVRYNKAQLRTLQQYSLFYMAHSRYRLGEWKEAITGYLNLLSKIKNTRFYYDAHYYLARSYLAANDVGKARKAASPLVRAPGRWGAAGKLVQGYIEEKNRKTSAARARFQQAADSRKADPAIRAEAYLGVARNVGSLQAKVANAKKAVGVGGQGVPRKFYAQAYMIIGRGQQQAGGDAALKQAAMAYLHVAELYPVSKEIAAEALYRAGECLLGINEKDATKARHLNILARKVLEQAKGYRGTSWAIKASKLLRRRR